MPHSRRADDEVFAEEEPAPVRARFTPLSSEGEVEALLSAPPDGALLFLHDPFCPISNRAYEEVERLAATVHIVDVARNSALGKLIQARTGIRHESPQAIVFRGGEPAWHASHGRIRLARLQGALGLGEESEAD